MKLCLAASQTNKYASSAQTKHVVQLMLAKFTQLPVTSQIYFHLQPWCLHHKHTFQSPSYQGLSSPQLCIITPCLSFSITGSKSNPTVTYAMSPGQVVQGLYDYSTNMGMKQWVEATKPLDDKPYDLIRDCTQASCHVELWTPDEVTLPKFKATTGGELNSNNILSTAESKQSCQKGCHNSNRSWKVTKSSKTKKMK